MGANYHGTSTFRCYNGCQPGGECPGHTIKVWSKHGAYYVDVDGQNNVQLPWDISFIDAVIEAMTKENT